jgi:3,4-dihydroxy 2-butanone 4-phosphate synthase/GTP cyclohydrolase II
MVSQNNAQHGTNFTLSIEATEGVTTGISAADRATTVLAAVAKDASPTDIVQPGHIFPLMAQPGGVLTRAGHTEAGCDLARLAGFEGAAVIVEILNEDGTMARMPDLEAFAKQHNLKMGTIADLIHYRTLNEKTVTRIAECKMPTEHGDFRMVTYQDNIDSAVHFAMVKGEPEKAEAALVRVHVQDDLCDLTFCKRDGCGWPLSEAMEAIAKEKSGVVIILRAQTDSEYIIKRVREYEAKDAGENWKRRDSGDDLRTYGLGAQIITDLGIHKMRVLSAPKRMHAISGFGLEIVGYVGKPDSH